MVEFKLKVDLGQLLGGLVGPIDKMVLPTLHQAVQAVASETAYRWKDAVAKGKIRNEEKQAYIQSINWKMTGDFSAIVETDYAGAEGVEHGKPAYDMKRWLQTSNKVRYATQGKHKGQRYLIIPFRHNTPGHDALAQAMPAHVYAQAKALKASLVTGTAMKHNGGTGARARVVERATYKWGGRLPAGLTDKLKPHHTTDIHHGMVRMKTSSGGQKSSQYMTFRVMGEWASGKWIIGAKPGQNLAKKVVDQMQIEAPLVFEQAIKHLK